MMSTAANKAIIRRVFEEGFNQGRLEVVDELFSTRFVDHSTPEQVAGAEGVKEYFASVHRGFPDMQVSIEDMVAEGEKVVVRTTWILQYPLADRRNEENLTSLPKPPDRVDSNATMPDMSRGFAPGIYDGVPASGRRVARTMMQIFRIVDGQIEEEWNEGASDSCPKRGETY